MFKPVSNKVDFPRLEEGILQLWDDGDIFKESLKTREGCPEYVFYDGPPFATGLPHYGHLLAGTIKDIVPRYHTMRGHYVARRFGWDCHGLPIEALAQEALELSGAPAIVEKGVDVFNEKCRSMVLTYVEEWRKTVTRMGRWVDFDDDYKTMDVEFMETIWWVFKQLWDKDMVYKAHRIMPYSWKLTTPLSNFEAGNNYKDVQDPSITVRMRLLHCDADLSQRGPTYILCWTTTPWTLPGNLAVCAGPDIEYLGVLDKESGDVYVLARDRLESYYKNEDDYEIVKTYQGCDLEGWEYEPLFPYFSNQPNAFRVLNDGFVSTEDGTGIVHLAPAYGEDDYRVCRDVEIDLVDPLDVECRFTEPVSEYAGTFCKDADKAIIQRLKAEEKLVHQSTIQHSYPFCERTDTPLIYRAIEAWYVKVEPLRDRLVEHNKTIHWVPGYVGEKRFGNWLSDAKDWNISRNRFWGSCIPVWVAEDGSDMVCVGSIDELEERSGTRLTDLHKHFVDEVTFEKDGKTYRRTPEVLDCWFESGAMPYAQCHYPFENKERFDTHFPADFIAEGLDQTRGWFYTLMVLSTVLFDRPAFKNCVVNGLLLAEDGRKMSKRLKNYPDPMYVLDNYGADALRLYMISSPVVRAEDLCFSEDGVKHALRHLLIPWWNAYSFFVTYALVDEWKPAKADGDRLASSGNILDRWVMSRLERLTEEVVGAMDQYELQQAIRPFVQFIEDLTNWYIRRSRRRFWKSTDDDDKRQAYATLYEILMRLSKISAPFVPFISEAIYQNLRDDDMPKSVHLCDFPTPGAGGSERDLKLEEEMDAVMTVVSMGRLLRSEYNLKVRQPLASIHVICRDKKRLSLIEDVKDMVSDELNVREVHLSADEAGLATLSAKPNFKRLGPRLGPNVKKVGKAIQELDTSTLEGVLDGGSVSLEVDGEKWEFDHEDLIVSRVPREGLAVTSESDWIVAIEIELDDDLIRDGLARELVNKVQNMRKEADYEVTQRIDIMLRCDDELRSAIDAYGDYIKRETLCENLEFVDEANGEYTSWDINGRDCSMHVKKA